MGKRDQRPLRGIFGEYQDEGRVDASSGWSNQRLERDKTSVRLFAHALARANVQLRTRTIRSHRVRPDAAAAGRTRAEADIETDTSARTCRRFASRSNARRQPKRRAW